MVVLVILLLLSFLIVVFRWLFMSSTSQLFGEFPYKIKTDQKIIALSFDDGPNEPYTSQLADFLNEQGIKATFFQVGKCVRRHPTVTKKLHTSGHIIGNHSFNHKFYKYFSEPSFKKEIATTQQLIADQIKQRPALFRSPWLWRTPLFLKMLRRRRLQPVSGIFGDLLEPFQPPASKIAKRALAKVRPGIILIFHDGFDSRGGDRHQTVEAVKLVVNELLKQQYRFVTVDQLLKVPAYKTNES